MELDRLIETERRNEETVRRASVEGAALVQAARQAVLQREAAFAAELDRQIAAMAAAMATERERRLSELAATSQAALARYAAVTDAQVAAVARLMVDELLANRSGR